MKVRVSACACALLLASCSQDAPAPLGLPPVVVRSPLHVPGVVVRGATSQWHLASAGVPRYGEPVPVELTAYCLTRKTTARGRYVRAGIVAADRRHFPPGRYLELYIGRQYLGRFLIDDTGRLIKGNVIDVWMPTCKEARTFGRQKGTAVLVPRDPSITLAGRPIR